MTEHIVVTDTGGVREIRFTRPEKKNAITGAMYDQCTRALGEVSARNDRRVVLITGEGAAFSAGNDLNDFLTMDGLDDAPPGRFIRALASFDKPVVAAVQGAAAGIGTTLLLHCDLVYAAPDAVFSVPFVSLGLTAEGGSSLILPMLLGQRRAAAMLLLGEPMDARTAVDVGLVNAVVPLDQLHAHALAKALALAAQPQAALRTTRALLHGGRDVLHAHMRAEEAAFSQALRSDAARDAVAAFLGRRG